MDRPVLHLTSRPPLDPPGGPAGRVVLVHGAMDRGGSFGRVGLRLSDVELVTYDRRGYAGSWGIGPSTRFEDQVADLLEVLGGRPAVVAGHSFGGNVALAAAARHPELVPAAVIFEAPAPWEPWWPSTTARSAAGRTPEEVAESFMRRVVGARIWEHLPAATREQRRAEGATLLAELQAVGATRPYDPAAVRQPVVVGWGSESPEHMRRAAQQLSTELPVATAVEVAGSSHGVHLTHPAELARLVRLALDAASGGDGRWV